MLNFSAEELAKAAHELGMTYPDHVLDQLVAAIDSGKHVVLTGPPGTGKTTLAYLAADVGQHAMLCTGYLPTTATTEWTTFAFDKNLLFEMSYALMRRFAFVEVTSPSPEVFSALPEGPGSIARRLLPLRSFRDLGPAVYLDAARFAARRLADDVTESRLLYEMFYAFFLPQFEGMDDARASALYRMVAQVLEPAEQAEAQRTIMEVLGVDIVP